MEAGDDDGRPVQRFGDVGQGVHRRLLDKGSGELSPPVIFEHEFEAEVLLLEAEL